MSERNKAHVRRVYEEIYNRGNLAVADELAARDIVIHTSSQEIRGREGAKQYVVALRAGFPDLHFTIEDQIADGDYVVIRRQPTAHKGQIVVALTDENEATLKRWFPEFYFKQLLKLAKARTH